MKSPFQISKLDYWIYGVSLGLCFLLFKQSDLTHTNSSSFAYLYGHFWDFYDYNNSRMGDNNYLPIFYWFFAIWNIPLKLLGLIPEVTSETWMHSTVIQTIWSKLLLVIFFFASVNLVGKISKEICSSMTAAKDINNEQLPALLFATSPIAIFAIFIFGGYDIFALFFILLGLRAYFAKDFKWFVVWFSVAISFKYFAAFAYLPLVLIIEKQFIRLVAYGLLGLAVTAIQFALYWHSDVFLGEIFGLATAKTAGNGLNVRLIVANSCYLAMCAYLYFSKFNFNENLEKWCQLAIFACLLAYALLFSWVMWHPQWIILITPFICLSYLFIQSKRLLLWVDILGYLGFVIFTMNNWVGNVDNTMIYGGVFASWMPATQMMASELMGWEWLGFARTAFYAMLFMPILIWAVEQIKNKKVLLATSKEPGDFSNFHSLFAVLNCNLTYLVKIRFLVGTWFLVLISVICLVRS